MVLEFLAASYPEINKFVYRLFLSALATWFELCRLLWHSNCPNWPLKFMHCFSKGFKYSHCLSPLRSLKFDHLGHKVSKLNDIHAVPVGLASASKLGRLADKRWHFRWPSPGEATQSDACHQTLHTYCSNWTSLSMHTKYGLIIK